MIVNERKADIFRCIYRPTNLVTELRYSRQWGNFSYILFSFVSLVFSVKKCADYLAVWKIRVNHTTLSRARILEIIC